MISWGAFAAAPAEASGPWQAQIVDADTGKPLEGVIVLLAWSKKIRTFGGPSGRYWHAEEMVTGPDGRFRASARRTVTLNPLTYIEGPEVTVFKPGYGNYRVKDWDKKPPEWEELSAGEVLAKEDVVLELQPLRNRHERLEFLRLLRFSPEVPLAKTQRLEKAIVDVTNGRLVASTAPPTMTLSHSTITTQAGDGSNGGGTVAEARHIIRPDIDFWASFPASQSFGNFGLVNCDHLPESSVTRIGTIDAYVFGTQAASLTAFTSELGAANFPSVQDQRSTSARRCISNFEPRPGAFPAIAFTVETTEPLVFHGFMPLFARTRTSPERIVLVYTQTPGFTAPTRSRLVVWEPEQGTPAATVRYDGPLMNVTGWSPQTAVGYTTGTLFHVVPLAGTAAATSLTVAEDTADDFIALEPGFVFNRDDLKFYRTVPTLERTALPRALVPSAVTSGDFHAVKLR